MDAAHTRVVEGNRLFDDHVPARLGGPLQLGGPDVGRRAGSNDLDAVVVEELVLALVFVRIDAVRLHQASGLAGRAVIDADDLGQRMVAERLDILACDPAGTENGYSVLLRQFARLPKTVGSLGSPDHGVKERGSVQTNTR